MSDDPRDWPGGGAHCSECGVPLTPDNMVGSVERKETAPHPGEALTDDNAAIIVMMCRTCFGLPPASPEELADPYAP